VRQRQRRAIRKRTVFNRGGIAPEREERFLIRIVQRARHLKVGPGRHASGRRRLRPVGHPPLGAEGALPKDGILADVFKLVIHSADPVQALAILYDDGEQHRFAQLGLEPLEHVVERRDVFRGRFGSMVDGDVLGVSMCSDVSDGSMAFTLDSSRIFCLCWDTSQS